MQTSLAFGWLHMLGSTTNLATKIKATHTHKTHTKVIGKLDVQCRQALLFKVCQSFLGIIACVLCCWELCDKGRLARKSSHRHAGWGELLVLDALAMRPESLGSTKRKESWMSNADKPCFSRCVRASWAPLHVCFVVGNLWQRKACSQKLSKTCWLRKAVSA